MKTILTLLLILPALVSADTMSVDLTLTAYHWDRQTVRDIDLNERNPGIGLHWTDGDHHKMIGGYKNSDYKQSAYVLAAYTPAHIASAKVGITAGVVTGYLKEYTPALGLYMVVPITDTIDVNITATPTIKSMKCYGFAGFQTSFRF